jgi:hypothetical protein
MMKLAIRLVLSVVLVGIVGFCIFGFFASYEVSNPFGFQTFYAMTGAMCALAVAGIWLDLRRALPVRGQDTRREIRRS